MSNEHDTTTRAEQPSQPGPDVLAERTLAGIFVHLLGLFTSFVGPLVVYAAADHEFTRSNARNALNWQVLYAAALAGVFLLAGLFIAGGAVLPDLVLLPVAGLLFVAASATVFVAFCTFAFSLVATGKAVFGSAWEYPLAPDVLDGDGVQFGVGLAWWTPLAVYVVTAPVLFGGLLWSVLGRDVEAIFPEGAFFVVVAFVLVVALFAPLAAYRDVMDVRGADTAWNPTWLAYVGVAVAGGAVTYLAATFYYGSGNPSGDAVYGYAATLWVVMVVYLVRRFTAGTTDTAESG
ncbi:DUF4870 domain-containing protein [Natronomonas marina]|jgi:uncharacterized Tic20 family protein|uniref:DUF4870 domain-containing protein n=1 Tax=Natronomonas marina TaxID=2961939 RepID=UPI0020C9BBEE|nr:DUF4870 domain-containing protein [Natronomonas marina]